MWFGVLGPLSVVDDYDTIGVPAAKQRALLATLLLHANHVMSFDDLARAVWDGEPASGANATVRNYVLRLRQVLGPGAGSRIVTREPGYLIELGEHELDVLRFRKLCREGGAAARSQDWQLAHGLLNEALGLWRGTPLADVPSQLLQRDEVPPLIQARLQALELSFEAALQLGRHAEAVTELQSWSARHPLRERFHALLMIALYRCGRQADALSVYRSARRNLADDLGIEPGPELRQLHDRILRADPGLMVADAASGPPVKPAAEAVIPRQLPAGTAHFAGRTAELAELTELLARGALKAAQVIAVIGGTPGIGKTALAVHWAHRCADRFPDGQLYANLRGFDPAGPPLMPAEAIRGFLDALEFPPQRIPAGIDEQVSLYRSLLADKRMLIVLDNARDEQQIRSLIPGGLGCRVLVTSRNPLAGLAASHGAHCLTLDALTEDEARELLVLRLGAAGLAAESGVISEVITRCARLPLALAIAAARATTGRRLSLADLADELRDSAGRLNALDLADPTMSVRGVFDWSYRALSPGAARLFGLIGVSPGPDVSVSAAASILLVQASQARALLRELARACLLIEPTPGRFTCHDLLRAYAAELGGRESEPDSRAALHRLFDHYLHTALGAALWLNPKRRPIEIDAPQPGAISTTFASDAEALAWFDAERAVLLATITAEMPGFDSYAWKLSWTLSDYFSYRGHWTEWYAAQRHAVAAARRAGDRPGQAVALRLLGQAATSLGDYGQARGHLEACIAIYHEIGDQVGEAAAHHDCARICIFGGNPADGLEHSRRSLELCRLAEQPIGVAASLNGLGWAYTNLGEHERALACCEEALALHRELGNSHGQAMTLDSIGYAHHKLGHHDQAISYFQQAVDYRTTLNDRWLLAETLDHLGDAHLAAGNADEATRCWRQALTHMDDLKHPGAPALRAKVT